MKITFPVYITINTLNVDVARSKIVRALEYERLFEPIMSYSIGQPILPEGDKHAARTADTGATDKSVGGGA